MPEKRNSGSFLFEKSLSCVPLLWAYRLLPPLILAPPRLPPPEVFPVPEPLEEFPLPDPELLLRKKSLLLLLSFRQNPELLLELRSGLFVTGGGLTT
jgi:hypothetical protein